MALAQRRKQFPSRVTHSIFESKESNGENGAVKESFGFLDGKLIAPGLGPGLQLRMPKQHWLVKQEPESYSWADFVKEGKTAWTGVRNFQARKNLKTMRRNDSVLFYHSGDEKQVVGLARVEKEAYPDPTATEGDWSCVDLAPVKSLKKPVTLQTIKGDSTLKEMAIVRQSRLSVSSITETQFKRLMELAGS